MFTTTMSFAAISSRALIFVLLSLIHDGVDGVQITELSRRRGGGPDDSSSSTQSHSSTTSTHFPVPQTTTSTSFNHTTSTSESQIHLAEARHIGTIVGASLGSVILVGLALMILAKYLSRARKLRKKPRGYSTCFPDQPPQTEMSQTQSGPLISTPLAYHPAPMQFLSASPSNNTYSSLSPLFLASTFSHSQDTTSSSHRTLSTSCTDGGCHALSDPIPSANDMQPSLSLVIPPPQRAVLAGSASLSTSGQLSPLHRDMVECQKMLEADQKGDISDQNRIIRDDPPPKYVG